MWPWYDSKPYAACMQQRLSIDAEQLARVNNEYPGGGVDVRRAAACSSVSRSLPHLVVLAAEKLQAEGVESFLSDELGFARIAEVFHSHLDDTKAYVVLRRAR